MTPQQRQSRQPSSTRRQQSQRCRHFPRRLHSTRSWRAAPKHAGRRIRRPCCSSIPMTSRVMGWRNSALCAPVYQMREKQSLKKVLVTSSLPKEGKSFVAANLAQVMVRQQGRRALLIDGDLRGPRLHQVLGTASSPGLSEYLLGEVDEFGAIQRGPMDNLFFIPSGRTVSSPAELVANGRLKFLLTRVEPLFDWIIIDSPPAVPVSDASLLANYCDGVLIVVRSNATPFDIARKARQEFRDTSLVGVVLNGIDVGPSYTQHYYSSHRHPNSHGDRRR